MAYNPYANYAQQYPAQYQEYTPDLQQRLDMMQRNTYNNRNSMQYGQFQPIQQSYTAIPVTCFEEAKAARISFDGSINIFLDTQNGCIYTKKINDEGIAELNIYKLVPPKQQINTTTPVQESPQPQYVSLEDFNSLKAKLEALEQKYEHIGGKQNVTKSNAVNESNRK